MDDGSFKFNIAPSGAANTTTITNGVSYTIITSGNQTAFGAANNNVGTVFTATSSGTLSSGTVSQNIDFTQAMTLNADGNLGIGTTTFAYKLEVNGVAGVNTSNANAAEFHIKNTSASARDWILLSTGSSWAGGGQTGYFNIYDNTVGQQRLTIDTSGNLGLGQVPVVRKFEINAIPAAVSQLNGIRLQMNGVATSASEFLVGTDSGGVPFSSLRTGNDGNSYMTFFTGSGPTERARITSGGTFQTSLDASIYGVTVGRGAGAVSTNTAVGASALAANTTGIVNVAVGQQALFSNTTGGYNVAIGRNNLYTNTTGFNNIAIGFDTLFYNNGGQNVAVGGTALGANTTGSNNTALGYNTLLSNTTASNNTAVGYQAGYSNTTGASNSAFGLQASYTNSSGNNNAAFGHLALYANTGGDNAAVGESALRNNTSGGSNTAVGRQALNSNTTASNNTAVGYQAGYSNTTGERITAVGSEALLSNTTGSYTVAVGYGALRSNTTGDRNHALGYASLYTNTTGSYNTVVGYAALFANTTGGYNSAVGYAALQANTTGAYNTAVGLESLYSNTTGERNTVIGRQAMYLNTTGGYNVSVGMNAMEQNTTASNSVAVGYTALQLNTTGANNVAVGYNALVNNTTASNNTAVGYQAAYSNTTGTQNQAAGYQALYSNTTGNANNAFGYQALINNTTGAANAAFGNGALQANTTASNNTAVGYQAGYNNQTAIGAVFIGYQAGYSSVGISTTINYNTAVGNQAGYALTSGYNNTFLGNGSGNLVTTGYKNTILGGYTGNQGGLDIRTASNYIVLSDGDGNPRWVINQSGTVTTSPRFNAASTLDASGATVTIRGNFPVTPLELQQDTTNNHYQVTFRNNVGTTAALVGSINSEGSYTNYNTGGNTSTATQLNYQGVLFAATQNASSNANTLDDYEEGTWTPTYQTTNNDIANFAYYTQQGKYVKVGKLVTVNFSISTTNAASISGTGGVQIRGLPFPVNDISNGIPVPTTTIDNRFTNNPFCGFVDVASNNTYISLYKTQAMNTANGLTVSDFNATNTGNFNLLSGTFSYTTV